MAVISRRWRRDAQVAALLLSFAAPSLASAQAPPGGPAGTAPAGQAAQPAAGGNSTVDTIKNVATKALPVAQKAVAAVRKKPANNTAAAGGRPSAPPGGSTAPPPGPSRAPGQPAAQAQPQPAAGGGSLQDKAVNVLRNVVGGNSGTAATGSTGGSAPPANRPPSAPARAGAPPS